MVRSNLEDIVTSENPRPQGQIIMVGTKRRCSSKFCLWAKSMKDACNFHTKQSIYNEL
jgi:hypothetical protein